MFIKKNDDKLESKENNIIQITKNVEGENYILKIYFSKDKESIIFKIVPDQIHSYYYYEKYNLLDFQLNYKRYEKEKNLEGIFENLKYVVQKQTIKMEKDLSNMKINFLRNLDIILTFNLRKKIISQNRLNPMLIGYIKEQKNQLKSIKKQSSKFEKSLKNQEEIINDLNEQLEAINTNITNIEKEITNVENMIQNKSKALQNQDVIEESRNKNNKNKKKKGTEIDNKIKNEDINKNNKQNDNDIFYFKNKPLCRQKRFLELIFVLNIFIIVFISYLYSNLIKIQNIEKEEKMKRENMKEKYTFINILETMEDEDIKYIKQIIEETEVMERESENKNEISENNNEEIDSKSLNENDSKNINNNFEEEEEIGNKLKNDNYAKKK